MGCCPGAFQRRGACGVGREVSLGSHLPDIESSKESAVSYQKVCWLPGLLLAPHSRTEPHKLSHKLKTFYFNPSCSEEEHWWDHVGIVTPQSEEMSLLGSNMDLKIILFLRHSNQSCSTVFIPRSTQFASSGSALGAPGLPLREPCLNSIQRLGHCCAKPRSPAGFSHQPGQGLISSHDMEEGLCTSQS